MSDTGWVWVQGQIVGNLENWTTCYSWDGKYHPTREDAIKAGFRELDHDDFNVARIEDGNVVWWGWMEEQHPLDDAWDAGMQNGWSVRKSGAGA